MIRPHGIDAEKGEREKQPQVLRLRLAQRTRQTPLRMTVLRWFIPAGLNQ
jgi:hypothetical protein